MLLKTKGIPYLIDEPIVAKVSRDSLPDIENYILISENEIIQENIENCIAILTNLTWENRIDFPSVYNVPEFDHLMDGDIVLINTDGVINTLYRRNSVQNFLLITERCNSNCIMCSQPPRDRDDTYLMGIYDRLIPLIPKDCMELGLTGGEPTLLGNHFFNLLGLIQQELPSTEIHCLTNGRPFAWKGMAERLGNMDFKRLMLGIPLYSDYYQVHDYIVQAKDAFSQTMQGLYNLALNSQRIELRVVLHQQSIPRLGKLARYIYRNLPFVEHIAFMGLEYQGYTPHNIEKLWIDPIMYMDQLSDAINYLHEMGMNVSIYNSQLCIIPHELWRFNRKSISDWKNVYLPQCNSCVMIEECGGLFASGVAMHSDHIRPFDSRVE